MILHPKLGAYFYANWLPQLEADKLLEYAKQLSWQQETIQLFGKTVNVPRKIIWIADSGVQYRYSGHNHHPTPWPEFLLAIKNKLNKQFKTAFNSALGNYYEDGMHSMGYHQDNEKELGQEPIIASLSLGASRRFLLKHIKTGERITAELPHGSLLLMYGNSQSEWRHALPKSKKVKSIRINFTFRMILQHSI